MLHQDGKSTRTPMLILPVAGRSAEVDRDHRTRKNTQYPYQILGQSRATLAAERRSSCFLRCIRCCLCCPQYKATHQRRLHMLLQQRGATSLQARSSPLLQNWLCKTQHPHQLDARQLCFLQSACQLAGTAESKHCWCAGSHLSFLTCGQTLVQQCAPCKLCPAHPAHCKRTNMQ